MKKRRLILTLAAAVWVVTGFSQNNLWTFPEQFWNLGTLPQNLPSGTYSGNPAEYVHAGIWNPYGEVLFTSIDGTVYDKDGDENGWPFWNSSLTHARGYSEALIVPEPGSCERFYLFQAGKVNQGGNLDQAPYFGII